MNFKEQNFECYLALRIKIYNDYDDTDEDTICLNYMNSTDDYLKGRYNLSKKEVIELTTLKIYADAKEVYIDLILESIIYQKIQNIYL